MIRSTAGALCRVPTGVTPMAWREAIASLLGRSGPRHCSVGPPSRAATRRFSGQLLLRKASEQNAPLHGRKANLATRLVHELQGAWEDDIGLHITVVGKEATFSDGSRHALEGLGRTVRLRGAELVGPTHEPLWRFPSGLERRWTRPVVPDEAWSALFHWYKFSRVKLWQALCHAASANRASELALLKLRWQEDTVAANLPEEVRERLLLGKELVPGVCVVHRRFRYRAVVVGCEAHCTAPGAWRAQMRVASLPKGGQQPFYHCAVDARDRPGNQLTFVAEENLEISHSVYPLHVDAARPLLDPCDAMKAYLPSPSLLQALLDLSDRRRNHF